MTDEALEVVGDWRWVIHLWAGGARRVELKAVHLWVSSTLQGS
ncbi:hypothetical protein PTW37_16610 (plasmid) [Arthrobacter agilis]|nr:hypothetical protein [Arthrobacter agilis]WDF35122.1 hypothetical protein PTW37_16610 [Arthrobacter agilis]